MGSKILDSTHYYDSMVLDYLEQNKLCKYIFLSSGSVYGGNFDNPVSKESAAKININQLGSSELYSVAKLYAEARHRAMSDYSVVDLRVFNYFSHTQDMNARFLITDIVRSIMNGEILKTTNLNILRDYITPINFYQLVQSVIKAKPMNQAIDCYTKQPVDKITILSEMSQRCGLKYELVDQEGVNATGLMKHYYSLYKAGKTIGYEPNFSSIEGLKTEVDKVLAK